MAASPDLAATPGTAPGTSRHPVSRILLRAGLALGVLAGLTVAICVAGARLGPTLALGGNTTDPRDIDILIGADHLRIPANLLRFEEQRTSGRAERVDLYATWPGMQGYSDETRERFNDVSRADRLIFLQISQSTMSRDMSGRIEPIYRHLFEGEGEPMPGPAGLTAHRMKANSGYVAETFFTAGPAKPGATDGYGIRCILPETPDQSTSADCQRDVHAGQDLVVLYRFSSQLLPQWQVIDEAVVRFVTSKLVR